MQPIFLLLIIRPISPKVWELVGNPFLHPYLSFCLSPIFSFGVWVFGRLFACAYLDVLGGGGGVMVCVQACVHVLVVWVVGWYE